MHVTSTRRTIAIILIELASYMQCAHHTLYIRPQKELRGTQCLA